MTNQKPWWSNRHEVVAFGRALVETDQFPPGAERQECCDLIVDYFDKPYGWSVQYQWWIWNGRTADQARWETAADDGYRIDYDRVPA